MRTIDGRQVVGIRGTIGYAKNPKTIFYSTGARHLPVEIVDDPTNSQKAVTLITGWNKAIRTSAAPVAGASL